MIIVNFDLGPLGLGGQDQIRSFFFFCWDLLLLVSNRLIFFLLLFLFVWGTGRIRF